MLSIEAIVIDLAKVPFHQQAAESLGGNLTVIGKNNTQDEIKFRSDEFSTDRLPGQRAVIKVDLPAGLDDLDSNMHYWAKVEKLYQASLQSGKKTK
ncbi:hypothetical protein COS31_02910 [Candidatus Roizmanbacteria bacterium CG02_land_8_20_14_3_00_36_15]|nr:MAG: hypothetical protein COS51_04445 [Candidatus Roizmanbacteria bacterium CG03_land_8_20_14_0_80_36_21]PIV37776.1 MAG: hypothetical protein COS31_02910 [Candidatus Roizmanbacteria bacterium CG02_land_8_20_14_3_00_36_15]